MIGFTSHTSNMIRTAGVRHRVIPASTFPTRRMARTGAESLHQRFGGLVDKDSITFDSSGRLYATWDEGNILALTWSDDDGNHWASIQNPGNVGFGVLGAVVGTFGASSVYLTWWDFSTDNIMFEASHDRGQTWGPQIRVNSAGGSAQQVGPWQIPIPA